MNVVYDIRLTNTSSPYARCGILRKPRSQRANDSLLLIRKIGQSLDSQHASELMSVVSQAPNVWMEELRHPRRFLSREFGQLSRHGLFAAAQAKKARWDQPGAVRAGSAKFITTDGGPCDSLRVRA